MSITTSALIAKFQQALDEKWGYIWGTAGKKWTAADQASLDKTTDSDRAKSRQYGSKWIGHYVADCSGLFSWAFKQLGGYMYHGSNTMWDKYCTAKGELNSGKQRADGYELKPGTAVFTYTKSTDNRGHVGLYIGGGYVIEARGAYYGVVKTKLTERSWAEWGELKGVDYESAGQDPAPAEDKPASRPTIRKGNKGAVVKEMQQMLDKLGYNLGICGVDGDYGVATEKAVREFQRDHQLEQDGICGAKTWGALQQAVDKINGQPDENKYTVTIKGLTQAQAEELCKAWSTATSQKE